MSTTFADPLGGFAPCQWDELAGKHFYSSSAWLRFCAKDLGGDVSAGAAHTAVEAGGRAAVAVTAVRDESNGFYSWQAQLAERELPAPERRGLLVGQRRGYQTHLLRETGTGRDEAAQALLAPLREAAREAASENRATPCVAMYLATPDVLAFRAAGVTGLPVALTADAWIPIEAEDWESWLRTLPSRRRAELIRREIRKFGEAGYIYTEQALSDCYEEAAGLLARTQIRYGQPADPVVLAESFRRQAEVLGQAARVLLCARPGEPPSGFCLYYRWRDVLFLRTAGFDYDRLTGAAEYFNLVYYEPIRRTAGSGVRWLHAGIESAEAKAIRGARLSPLWLLDLSEKSVLDRHQDDVRTHNARYLAALRSSSRAVDAALSVDDWLPFI